MMKLECSLRPVLSASLLTIIMASLLAFGLIINIEILGFSFFQIVCILSVAIIIEVPQTLGRALLLLFFEGLHVWKGKNVNVAAYPKISVIVPAHNEEQYIEDTLASLLEDTYPNKEVIVVDDGSTDKTYIKALAFTKDSRVKVVRREKPTGAKAKAVNYGLLFATGDIIIVVDGDTIVERHAIKKLVKPMLDDPSVVGVAGNVKVANKRNLLTRLQAYEYLISMEMGRRWQAMLSGLLVIPGAFGAVRRDTLDSLGRMHADTITEDFDMTLMLQKAKGKIAFSHEAIAWTHVPERWKEWVKQRIRWASGQIQVYIKHSNILLRRRFGIFGVLIAPNNIFMDMAALLIRYFWLAAIFLPHATSPVYAIRLLLIITSFYLTLECIQLISALLLTPRKNEVKDTIYAPLIIPYRALHAAIRLFAYASVLLGRRTRW
jgi:cellulose synthase/poly-beta-1,6-N-acetylglucosamine synthase-like glycosyltransferase